MALSSENDNSFIEQVSLIDILYKDTYRIDSYVSQIMRGILKRRKIKETSTQTNTEKVSGSLAIFTGDYTKDSQDMTTEEFNFIPHDHNVIDLLDRLNLSPLEYFNGEEIAGHLVWLKCRLTVRDFKTFTEFIPIMAENAEIFNVKGNEIQNLQKIFKAVAKIIPLNIEVECFLQDNSVVRGILNEKYLLTAYQDIIAMYGAKLPGRWNIVGILDSLNFEQVPSKKSNSFRLSMDAFSKVAETFYREGNPRYSITPILIFRGLEK